jgi:hypothetical protein
MSSMIVTDRLIIQKLGSSIPKANPMTVAIIDVIDAPYNIYMLISVLNTSVIFIIFFYLHIINKI